MDLTAGQALLAFAGWTGLHTLGIVSYRGLEIMGGKAPITAFPSGKPHRGNAFYQRLLRSHANCIENLPLFAVVILLNKAFGGPNVDALAAYYFTARVGQSVTHCMSTSAPAIWLRFSFFSVQLLMLFLIGAKTWPSLG